MSRTDTSPRAREMITNGLRRLSPEARLRMALAMSEECRELARVGARTRAPSLGSDEIESRVAEAYLGPQAVLRINSHRALIG